MHVEIKNTFLIGYFLPPILSFYLQLSQQQTGSPNATWDYQCAQIKMIRHCSYHQARAGLPGTLEWLDEETEDVLLFVF